MTRYQYRVTRAEDVVRSFACEVCSTRGEVSFRAIGSSGWVKDSWFRASAANDAHAAAGYEFATDTDRTHARIRCPTCGARGGVRGMCVRIGIWVAITLALAILGGGEDGNATWAAILAGGVLLWVGWRELHRTLRARDARFTKLVPGRIPHKPGRAAKPALPTVRVISIPPPRARTVERPVPMPVTPLPPPPADGDPRFLRHDDRA